MHRREERAIRDDAKDLIAEAEAIVTGRLVERHWWDDKEQGWMWLNCLAHADWSTLSEMADGARTGRGSLWDAAAMFLAGELLATAGSAEGLVALQRAWLVPLEAELLALSSGTPSTPGNLVSVVRAELDRARARRARDSAKKFRSTPH
jgi:hypothetical protein